MRNKKNQTIASLLASIMVVSGACAYSLSKSDNMEEKIEPKTKITTIEDYPKYEFHYYNDTVDVESEIDKLNINNNDMLPYNTYKVIRYVDSNHFERISIYHVYVTFLTDSEGKITDTLYTYQDIFSGEQFLTTTDGLNDHVGDGRIENYNSSDVISVLDQGDLLDLRDIVIKKGLDSSYAYSVMSDDIKDKTLSTYDVARMYVLLVNSNNRSINHNNAIILSYN